MLGWLDESVAFLVCAPVPTALVVVEWEMSWVLEGFEAELVTMAVVVTPASADVVDEWAVTEVDFEVTIPPEELDEALVISLPNSLGFRATLELPLIDPSFYFLLFSLLFGPPPTVLVVVVGTEEYCWFCKERPLNCSVMLAAATEVVDAGPTTSGAALWAT